MRKTLFSTTFLRILNLNLFLVLFLFPLSGSVEATEIYWNADSGGSFQDINNWNGDPVPGVAGTVPTADDVDTAVFDTGGNTYTVEMSADHANYRLAIRNDNVTLDLANSTHTIANNKFRVLIR